MSASMTKRAGELAQRINPAGPERALLLGVRSLAHLACDFLEAR
jgi:hypothetical protein